MSTPTNQPLSGAIFEESDLLTVAELSRICAVDERHIRMAFQRHRSAAHSPRAAARARSRTQPGRRRAGAGSYGRSGAPAARASGEKLMAALESDAFVFFGATGDLAYKKIFPALYAMIGRGLDIPIIGMARAGWTLDKLTQRARESIEHNGDFDSGCFAKLRGPLRYVDGDYTDPATFGRLKQALGGATRPIHYLAIPPEHVPKRGE